MKPINRVLMISFLAFARWIKFEIRNSNPKKTKNHKSYPDPKQATLKFSASRSFEFVRSFEIRISSHQTYPLIFFFNAWNSSNDWNIWNRLNGSIRYLITLSARARTLGGIARDFRFRFWILSLPSFDHPISSSQYIGRNSQTELLGGFEIDHKLKLRRLLNG
jgi:hypothetical protein